MKAQWTMLCVCSLQHTVVPLLLCGKREAEQGPSAAQKPHSGKEEVGYAFSCFFCRVSWKKLKVPVPQDGIAHSCWQLSTFQQVVLVLSQLFSFCAVSVRRTEVDTGLSYRNLSSTPRGNIMCGAYNEIGKWSQLSAEPPILSLSPCHFCLHGFLLCF